MPAKAVFKLGEILRKQPLGWEVYNWGGIGEVFGKIGDLILKI